MDLELMRELSVKTDSKIVLLILDGLGGLPLDAAGPTELEAAESPNFDALAARSDLGLSVPVAAGVSPGSGPGHLALFGYTLSALRSFGRGVLAALGVGSTWPRATGRAALLFDPDEKREDSSTEGPAESYLKKGAGSWSRC